MRRHRKCKWLLVMSTVLVLSHTSLGIAAQEKKAQEISLRGYVACVDENGNRLSPDHDCNQNGSSFELLTKEQKRYKFAPTDPLVAMFTESRVRKMELLIKGLLSEGNRLELAKIQALREGKLFDIFYYCEVCEITAYGPGPCFCCYNPFVYREVLATDQNP